MNGKGIETPSLPSPQGGGQMNGKGVETPSLPSPQGGGKMNCRGVETPSLPSPQGGGRKMLSPQRGGTLAREEDSFSFAD